MDSGSGPEIQAVSPSSNLAWKRFGIGEACEFGVDKVDPS